MSSVIHISIAALTDVLPAIDVDFFKQVNDQYGHPSGDKVLQGLADTMQKPFRTVDIVARLGGEEFYVLIP